MNQELNQDIPSTIANINYRGQLMHKPLFNFGHCKPRQFVYKCVKGTMVVFPNGKFRLMGCKSEITTFPFQFQWMEIQSITVTTDLKETINLYRLQEVLGQNCMYEPELFSALRFTKYNPLCVNIFSTGKVVIMGLKNMDHGAIVNSIVNDIRDSLVDRDELAVVIANEPADEIDDDLMELLMSFE